MRPMQISSNFEFVEVKNYFYLSYIKGFSSLDNRGAWISTKQINKKISSPILDEFF